MTRSNNLPHYKAMFWMTSSSHGNVSSSWRAMGLCLREDSRLCSNGRENCTNEKSTLVQVMAWCHQATGHYLSQCWPKSMSPYDITRPYWVNSLAPGRCSFYHKLVIFKLISRRDISSISCKIALGWMPQDLTDDWSTLIEHHGADLALNFSVFFL